MRLPRLTLVLIGAAVFFLGAGCGLQKKEITSLQRKEAANLVSEAEFALSLRDYARAEPLLAKATVLCPDTGAFWLSLGQTRVRLGQRDNAKTAYKSALAAYVDAAKATPADPQPVLQQVTVLVLLGRSDEARALIDKLPKLFPDNRNIRGFLDGKVIDRMQADPKFKEVAL